MAATIALVAVFVAGFFVTSWIAARVSGWAGFGLLAAWLAIPYPLLWFVAAPDDPTLDARRAAYDHQFTFVVLAVLITVPWLLLSVFGFQRGRRRRTRSEP